MYVCDSAGDLKIYFTGCFESMPMDMSKLAIRLEINLEITHLLKSKRAPIESYYDEATRYIVRGRYANDFRLLGYDDK